MSHENSITVKNKYGRWVNISGNVNGKFSPRKAHDLYRSGSRKPLGGRQYKNERQAVRAAIKRSNSFNRKSK